MAINSPATKLDSNRDCVCYSSAHSSHLPTFTNWYNCTGTNLHCDNQNFHQWELPLLESRQGYCPANCG